MTCHETIAQSLRAHFRTLYRRQRLFGKSADTVRLYEIALNEFDAIHGREATIHDLRDDAVIAMMQAIIDRGLTNRTANRSRECIVALWSFLARKRIVDSFPDVPRLPEAHDDPIAWTMAELRMLWQACRDAPGMIGEMTAARYWLVLHSLLWDSCDRAKPVRLSVWENVHLHTGWASFPSATRKGKRESNTFKLHKDTMDMLIPIKKASGPVLPWPYSWTYIYKLYDKLLDRAGLPKDRFHKFHAIRRSAGSWIDAAGGDATRALGHSSERITRKHYLDPRVCATEQPADLLFRPDDGPRAA